MKIKQILLIGTGVVTAAALLWFLYERALLDDFKLDFTEHLD